ncbi:MAG: hypothetical protein GXP24_10155 [Planctomycetes bacterium]|nr:hypothetical protein [Planctomycetota bacterium]
MPCYLFTYHGYGTWLPDHPRGYVRRKEGILPTDKHMAECYRKNQREETACFNRDVQRVMIGEAIEACTHQDLRGHGIATDPSHLHVLVSWKSERTWQAVRRSLRSSLTRRLNQEVERRTWFSKQPSRKQVKERSHFEYLLKTYLPKHRGLKWCEDCGVFS